jgi:hypothetical protein
MFAFCHHGKRSFRSHKSKSFLDQLSGYELLKEDSLLWSQSVGRSVSQSVSQSAVPYMCAVV